MQRKLNLADKHATLFLIYHIACVWSGSSHHSGISCVNRQSSEAAMWPD